MEIDLNIFNFFYKLKNKKNETALSVIRNSNGAVSFEDLKVPLAIFATAIFKREMEVRSTEENAYLSGNIIFLPSYISITNNINNNKNVYYLIILHLFALTKLEVKLLNQEDELVSKIKDLLADQFPNYLEMIKDVEKHRSQISEAQSITISKAKSKVGFNESLLWKMSIKNRMTLSSVAISDDEIIYPDVKTEKQNKLSGKINKVNLNEDEENIGQDVFHHFEKIETIEEYKGINRDTDGDDSLDDHLEALSDINLEEVVRSSKKVQSLYKTEVDLGFEVSELDTLIEEVGLRKFNYDEWDSSKKQYKKDWCTLYEEKLEEKEDLAFNEKILKKIDQRKSEIALIKKKLMMLTSEVSIKKKLLDGKMIDIDNFVRNQAIIKATKNGDGRYYKNVVKRHRDMAMIVLVDCSLSSDSWVNNQRILDICLDSLLVFGESVNFLNDPLYIAGFNSNTRNSCKFIEWKNFDESWHSFKQKLSSVRPDGFTRIGPAIRHAKFLLDQRKEKQKMLLILTDGRPTDYDRYEGLYGLSDVRKAIKECEQTGIIPFALAVDPSSKQFLPNLFGHNNYQILSNIQKLPEALTKLYIRLSKVSQ